MKSVYKFSVLALALLSIAPIASAQIGGGSNYGYDESSPVQSQNGGQPGTLKKRRFFVTGDFLPLTNFGISGAISENGGTRGAWGQTVVLNGFQEMPDGRRFGVGGWFFRSSDDRDLFQIHTSYFGRPKIEYGQAPNSGAGKTLCQVPPPDLPKILITSFGLQLAYLNSNKGNAASSTGFAILNLDLPKQQLHFSGGAGLYVDLAKQIRPTFGDGGSNTEFPLVPRQTVSFTYFVNGAYSLNKKGSLSAEVGAWYVHDRNVDFNRFTLGLGYKF